MEGKRRLSDPKKAEPVRELRVKANPSTTVDTETSPVVLSGVASSLASTPACAEVTEKGDATSLALPSMQVDAGVRHAVCGSSCCQKGMEGNQGTQAVASINDENPTPPLLTAEEALKKTEALLAEHHDCVSRYAYRMLGCNAAAEDLTQEVFLRVFKNVHQLKEDAAARGWLLAIARNEFIRWCKRKKHATSLDDENTYIELVDAEATVGEAMERSEWIQAGLSTLTEDYRITVAMYYYENLSYAEIAEQLEIPIGTVMSRLSRAKKHLKEHLSQTNGYIGDSHE